MTKRIVLLLISASLTSCAPNQPDPAAVHTITIKAKSIEREYVSVMSERMYIVDIVDQNNQKYKFIVSPADYNRILEGTTVTLTTHSASSNMVSSVR